MTPLRQSSASFVLLALLTSTLTFAEVFFETGFELETVDSAPTEGSLDLSPDSPEATKGVTIINGASTPSSPFGGKSLYIYDLGDTGNVRYAADIDGGSNVSSVQVDFDFAVDPAITGPASDTEINFTVGLAGVSLTSSSRRAFEFRILQDGGLDMRSEGVSTEIGTFSTGDTHHMTVFLNSDDTLSLDYNAAGVGSGTLSPNTFHVYLDGGKLGEYDFFLDPSDAAVAYNTGSPDLGQVAFYQDTGSAGALIVDNLKIADIEVGGVPDSAETIIYSAFDFESDTVGAEPVGFNDNSFTPADGTNLQVIDGASDPASPLTGQSLYILDSTISDNVRLGGDFNGGVNVEAVQVSFDFTRGPAQAEGERIAFSITHAGLNPTSSSRRPFELRLNEDGSIDMRSGPDVDNQVSDDDIGAFNPAALNHMAMLFNSNDTDVLEYDNSVGSGTISSNSFHVYLNDSFLGEFAIGLDPSDPAVDFAAGVADLGRFAFYQDTNSLGSLIVDDLVFESISASTGGSGGGGETIYSELDFDADTPNAEPDVEDSSISPGSATSSNGVVVIDGDSPSLSNPFSGQSLRLFDESTSESTKFGYLVDGGENLSSLRLDFDFHPAFEIADTIDEVAEYGANDFIDAGIRFTVGQSGLSLNSSVNRIFDIRLYQKGFIRIDDEDFNSGDPDPAQETLMEIPVSGGHLTILLNSSDVSTVDYDIGGVGAGTVPVNSFHLFVDGTLLGEFALQTEAYNNEADLGQILFYQDGNSLGDFVIDNVVAQRIVPLTDPPSAPVSLALVSAEPFLVNIEWDDTSDDETSFVIERQIDDGIFEVIDSVAANVTEYLDETAQPLTDYTYRILADNGLKSDPSNELPVSTPEQVVPLVLDFGGDALLPSGSAASLEVEATGRDPLSFQWYVGESGDVTQAIEGATGSSYQSDVLTSTTQFWVRISNSEGTIDSETFVVEVREAVVYEVSNESELEAAITAALPGDEIVILNGEYPDLQIEFQAVGLEAAPITLKAESPGEVVLSQESRLEIGGEWLVVEGLAFVGEYSGNDDEVIQFRSDTHATDCRLTNVSVIDYIPSDGSKTVYVGMYGLRNRVDHCYFTGHSVVGNTLLVELEEEPNYHLIDHNHFANRPNGAGENGWETIRIGESATSLRDSRTTVEYNLFTNQDGEIEIISNKSGENIYRYNTFMDCKGALTLRHGDRCLVEGNYFLGGFVDGSSGVRVIGSDHVIINNYFSELDSRGFAPSPISLFSGISNGPLNGYVAADNTVVAFNTFYNNRTGAIDVATQLGSGDRTVVPSGVVVANNIMDAGSFTTGDFVTGTGIADQTWAGNMAFGRTFGGGLTEGFTIADPLLEIESVSGIARPSATSPVIDGSSDVFDDVDIDIDGQDRDTSPDVGADEVADSPIVLSGPLTAMDTGPDYLGPERILGGATSLLVNQSLRANVSPGSGTLIGGFVVRSGEPKSMLIRGIGPGLIDQGVINPITDPVLTVYNEAGEPILTNDDWGSDDAAGISEAGTDVGAFDLVDGSTDAAILADFNPGIYTIHVVSKDGSLGEALIEVYDISGDMSLANQSSRSKRDNPEEVSIAGFVIGGEASKTLLIRGVGPGIAMFGLEDATPDVAIELFNEAGASLASNDDWGSSANASEIETTSDSVGAFPFETDSKDAALLLTLEPGLYTVHLTGPNDSVGVSLIELYEVLDPTP